MSDVRVISEPLPALLLLEPVVHLDERGFLVEIYRRDRLAELGIRSDFAQYNQSRSVNRTLRGLHFQTPPGQAKLVRVARGQIVDVVVDLRRSSPTFGRHATVGLDDVNHRQLFVPAGFAHGFCVTSELADVCYLLSEPYDPVLERGLAWDDPALAIDWPTNTPILSQRDRTNPRLAELSPELTDFSSQP